jgi:hypothetical protein
VNVPVLREFFTEMDKNGDGSIDAREMLVYLRRGQAQLQQQQQQQQQLGLEHRPAPSRRDTVMRMVLTMLRLPARVRQEDGSRDEFERIFQACPMILI